MITDPFSLSIVRYLEKDMTTDEKLDFEQELLTNAELNQAFLEEKQIWEQLEALRKQQRQKRLAAKLPKYKN
jgi:ferric-dicitrate binding protein FerR (iron transport regulator)